MASRKVLNAGRAKESVFEDLRNEHEARLKKAITTLEVEVVSLASQLKTSNGLLVVDEKNLQDAFDLRFQLVELFEREYNGAFITPTVNDFDEMAIAVKDYFNSVNISTVFTDADLSMITALKEGSFVRLDVLGKQFQSVLADEVYTSVVSGRRFTDMVKNLKGALVGLEDVSGRPMEQHAKTLAHDALISMDRSVSAKKAEDVGIENYLYFGSTVRDSRSFCVRYAGETKPLSEWEEIARAEDWSGKASSDILSDAGGYNCGHSLIPVP